MTTSAATAAAFDDPAGLHAGDPAFVRVGYRADIDGLRAVAVLAVLAFHAFPARFPGGFVGVDVFFVISGYLITGIIRAHLVDDDFSIRQFYARRIRRIFPALSLVLAATLVAGWFLLFGEEYRRLGKHVAAGAAFLSNVFLWRETDYFDPVAATKPLLHLWSLGIEEQFYLVWPLLLGVAARMRVSMRWPVLVVGLLSFVACVATSPHDATAAFYAPWTRFWELATGAWLAIELHVANSRRPTDAVSRGADLRAWAGGLLLAIAFASIDEHRVFPGWLALLPVVGTALLISAGPRAWINRVLLSHRIAVAIGLVSFPLYLWHWPILAYLRIVAAGNAPASVRLAALVLALLLAIATFRFVERPLRTRGRHTALVALVVAMVALGAAGAVVYAKYGFPGRPVNAPFAGDALERYYGSRQSDGSCATRLGRMGVDEEVCLANAARPRVLFIGDSHAMALYSAIYDGRFAEDAALVAGHSCALYAGLAYRSTHRASWANNCAAIAADALALVAATPSIETVVVANKPPDFGAGPSNWLRDGVALDEATAFDAGDGALIGALLAQRRRVVYVTGVPEFPRPPTECEPRLSFVTPARCTMDLATYERSRATYRLQVERLAQRFPTLAVFDPTASICPAGVCNAKAGTRYLYEDEQHLGFGGSARLLEDMRAKSLLP